MTIVYVYGILVKVLLLFASSSLPKVLVTVPVVTIGPFINGFTVPSTKYSTYPPTGISTPVAKKSPVNDIEPVTAPPPLPLI